ncbi:MAG: DUF2158 domain-containing protein [Nitrososphaeraceae archaeon]
MKNEFKIGDIVQLKSGGPKMTIYEIQDDVISCASFTSNEEFITLSMPGIALVKYKKIKPKGLENLQ